MKKILEDESKYFNEEKHTEVKMLLGQKKYLKNATWFYIISYYMNSTINKISKSKESQSLNIVLLLIGTLIGFGANFFLDLTSFERNSKAYRFNDIVEKRFNTFEELSKMTGERLYVTRKLLGSYQVDIGSEKHAAIYDEIVKKWNIDIYRFYALLDNLYDTKLRKKYEIGVNDPLVRIGKKIRRGKDVSRYVSRKLDTISMNILEVDKLLLERLHEEKNLIGE